MSYRELLIGCGHKRDKRLGLANTQLEWKELHTLDVYPGCKPDYICDLNVTPWDVFNMRALTPALTAHEEGNSMFKSDFFDEIHAYEVLEHLGQQGNAVAFFDLFTEIWRVLKPNGVLFATCPSRVSPWLWGDPSHRRVIQKESLVFLEQTQYIRQLDCPPERRTPMSDFRHIYKADFNIMASTESQDTHSFALRAVKPSRCSTL